MRKLILEPSDLKPRSMLQGTKFARLPLGVCFGAVREEIHRYLLLTSFCAVYSGNLWWLCSPLDCKKAATELGLLGRNEKVLIIRTVGKPSKGNQDSGMRTPMQACQYSKRNT